MSLPRLLRGTLQFPIIDLTESETDMDVDFPTGAATALADHHPEDCPFCFLSLQPRSSLTWKLPLPASDPRNGPMWVPASAP
eukprot:2938457-Prorocentrum_lima.AAC.1